MSENLDPSSPDYEGNLLRAVVIGTATAVVFGLGGFLLIRDESGAMGATLFVLLPFATGTATALVVSGVKLIRASLLMGAIICSGFLIATKMEGWVCLLMSTPLIAVGLIVGAVIGVLFRRHVIDKRRYQRLFSLFLLLLLAVFLMGANRVERDSRRTPRLQTVINKLVVKATPDVAWNQLKSLDHISSSKGLLMRIGLPVPVRCTMQGEGVGAKRTCYFESGHIEERVTEWNPPNLMSFEITDFDVPGRPWLSFKDASYELTQENGQTVIVRTTTIVSRLSPAAYWRPLEKLGVETEHEYLFEELKKRIDGVK